MRRVALAALVLRTASAWDPRAADRALALLEKDGLRCAGYCKVGPTCTHNLHTNRTYLPPAFVEGESVARGRALGGALDDWWCGLPAHEAFPTSFTVAPASPVSAGAFGEPRRRCRGGPRGSAAVHRDGAPSARWRGGERAPSHTHGGRSMAWRRGPNDAQVGKTLRALAAAQAFALADSRRFRRAAVAAPARVDYGAAAAAFARAQRGTGKFAANCPGPGEPDARALWRGAPPAACAEAAAVPRPLAARLDALAVGPRDVFPHHGHQLRSVGKSTVTVLHPRRRRRSRAVRGPHRHAVARTSRRWRGGRRADSPRRRREMLYPHRLLWWLLSSYWAVTRGWSRCGAGLIDARLGRVVARGPPAAAPPAGDAPRGVRSVGVHVRRGDACESWAVRAGGQHKRPAERPCYPSRLYVAAVETLVAEYPTISTVVVASDAQDAVQDLVTALTPRGLCGRGVPSTSLSTPSARRRRVAFLEANRTKYAAARFIEERRFRPEAALDVTLDIAADLRLLAREADAFVGTAVSWVSRLALLASLRAAIIVSNAPDSLVDFHAGDRRRRRERAGQAAGPAAVRAPGPALPRGHVGNGAGRVALPGAGRPPLVKKPI